MKRFIIRLLIFTSMMILLDRGFGVAMKYLQENAKGGYVGHHNYILNQSNEDIMIFGSSRAIHHYNPQIIEDSLGMSCYNCGQDGNGIIMFYGWWQIMKNRHLPKMIIYDVNPEFDVLAGDNIRYLGWLRSEYDNEGVKQVFEDVDKTEKYKMLSMMYRYNSKFLQNVIDYVHPIFLISPNGYLPVNGEMDKMKVKIMSNENNEYKYDSLKLLYLETFIKEAKENNIRIIMVASPVWYGKCDKQFLPLTSICEKYDIQFENFSNDTFFVQNDEMFKDGNHLNAHGADEFTKEICNILNNKLQ